MLDGLDPRSLTWRTLVEYLEPELARLQKILEDPEGALLERHADILRGEIKRIHAILALTDQPKPKAAPRAVGPDAR